MRLLSVLLLLGIVGIVVLRTGIAQDKNQPPAKQPNQPNQPGKGAPEMRPEFQADLFLKDHDQNNDGKLSKEELPQHMQAGFAAIDANKDGAITKEELIAHTRSLDGQRPEVVEVLWWVIDVPDPEPASAEEVQRLYESLRKVDKNNDGKIDEKELEQCRTERRKERVDAMLKSLDKNNDGKVAQDEVRGLWARNFKEVDTNNDGSIDRTELEKAVTPVARQRQPGQPGQPGQPNQPNLPKPPDRPPQ